MRIDRRTTALALALAVILASLPRVAAAVPPESAHRVISLNPSLTAILVALGARDRLVGVDEFSARQEPAVAELPRVGGLYDPSLEAVVALHPDLVVLVPSAQQRDFREQLRAVNVAVLEVDPVTFDDVLRSIEQLGERVGRREAAAARVAEIRRVREAVTRAAEHRSRARAVLVLQREPLYLVGGGSFVDEMLRAAGAENLGAGLPGLYPHAGKEWLVAAAPDVILDASPDAEPAAAYWARWPSLPAVRTGRVVAVAPRVVTLPGPWLDQGLLALSRAIEAPAARSGIEASRDATDTGSVPPRDAEPSNASAEAWH